MSTNPELELAFNYVSHTNRHVFLTGKAGTGKTTFLHRTRLEVPKRLAVVAPTGVAAINAKGVTIHSLFQLPFGVIPPGKALARGRRFSKRKVGLLRSLDLLVIDEVSMVRADVLDGIDEVLRCIRNRREPFGGVQLLLIGDLHQLPPIVKDTERQEMDHHFPSAFFFGSHALRKASPVPIELRKIYRQADERFINLLNHVRDNELDADTLAQLNERYQAGFQPADDAGYITISSHKRTARSINEEKLWQTKGKPHHFSAQIQGDFPPSLYPNEPEMSFKIGAQVMFNKNDTIAQEYYNGKIGKITSISEEFIHVRCPGEKMPIAVAPVVWENRKYRVNKTTGGVDEQVVGSYVQHPLRLAWAITIHKSQGLTFEKVVIDAAAAFAHGQVYVALSRCKTLEGIVLRTPIDRDCILTDDNVQRYSIEAGNRQPSPAQLAVDMRAYRYACLRELFGCQDVEAAAIQLRRCLLEHERSLLDKPAVIFAPVFRAIQEKFVRVGEGFLRELAEFERRQLDVSDLSVAQRVIAAAAYFQAQLLQTILPELPKIILLTDNQAVEKVSTAALADLQRAVFVFGRLLFVITAKTKEEQAFTFDTNTYCRARTLAELDFLDQQKTTKAAVKKRAPKSAKYPALFEDLRAWRAGEAAERDVPVYVILPNDALLGISTYLPCSKSEMLGIKKLGPKTWARYGEELLDLVERFVKREALRTEMV